MKITMPTIDMMKYFLTKLFYKHSSAGLSQAGFRLKWSLKSYTFSTYKTVLIWVLTVMRYPIKLSTVVVVDWERLMSPATTVTTQQPYKPYMVPNLPVRLCDNLHGNSISIVLIKRS